MIKEPQYSILYDKNSINHLSQTNSVKAKPFVKWAGGKAQLLSELAKFIPQYFNNYFEPFLGGGAFFFFIQQNHSNRSYLSDLNEELINLYKVVQNNVTDLINELKLYINTKDYYYETRNKEYSIENMKIENAARFIYLNKTCYNGLYRVNSNGKFNVPFGHYKNPVICDEENLHAASLALQNCLVQVNSYEDAIAEAKRDDFLYFDPPYHPLSKTSNFTSYTKSGFAEKDQEQLSKVFVELNTRGCKVMLSNSESPKIRELYAGFHFHTVQASRAINCKAEGRGKITELIITNY